MGLQIDRDQKLRTGQIIGAIDIAAIEQGNELCQTQSRNAQSPVFKRAYSMQINIAPFPAPFTVLVHRSPYSILRQMNNYLHDMIFFIILANKC